jgi:exopolyphosphatase/guanosine-5'-triphosphate,3'-diphosphate pyrophosphatase
LKIGIIDIGSNTFNLFIAEIDQKGNYTPIYRSKVPVKLGEGSFEKRYITEEAMQRAFVALDAQIMAIKNQYCDRILAFATSAVRNATNGTQFVEKVKERFGISIHVIDGDREAQLIFRGTRLAGALIDQKSLIMDIGGGSTEFIIATENELFWKRSYELGVTRVLEKFKPSDPFTTAELDTISTFYAEAITDVFAAAKDHKVTRLVGSSGSFDTFSDVLAYRNGNYQELLEQKATDFDFPKLKAHLDELIGTKLIEREKMPGMSDFRVKMIAMSALMVRTVLENTDMKAVTLSRYSLKEGALFEMLRPNT